MSKSHVSAALRERVTREALRRCGYCLTQEAVTGTPMQIEHLIPESLGGPTEQVNLWLACGLCNLHKGDRIVAVDPGLGEVVRLFNPRAQAWAEHFAWSATADRILGRTSTGRATVVALHLNRPSLIAARRVWVSAGWHPPQV
jgi:hypothetical protein